MRGLIRGVITLPVTNHTAAAHLKGVVLRGGDSNAFTECGCERVSNWLLSQCGGCQITLAPVAVPAAAAVDSTAAAAGAVAVAGGAAGVEEVCSG